MTSIAIESREAGTVSCCPVVEKEEDAYAVITTSRFAQAMRFTIEPEDCLKLGEALVKIGKELQGRSGT